MRKGTDLIAFHLTSSKLTDLANEHEIRVPRPKDVRPSLVTPAQKARHDPYGSCKQGGEV
jgi:hypothetical protein